MNRYPFPIPFGWFQVCEPDEVAVGAARALFYFDRHLVAWRDEEEHLHVMDAFCPHLGAHLGHGGTVAGCEIQCPFHGWRFDTEGTNVDIPYSTRTNKRARIRTYPTLEVNGKSLVWFHPDPEVGPQWDVPALPELEGGEFFGPIRTRHTVMAHAQELGENAVDSAHFRYVHNTAEVPEITDYVTDGPVADMRSIQKFPTPRGVVDGKIESLGYGPGVSIVRFSGIIDTLLVSSTTPIDAEQQRDRASTSTPVRWATPRPTPTWPRPSSTRSTASSARTCRCGSTRPTSPAPPWPTPTARSWPSASGTSSSTRRTPSATPGDERTLFPPPHWPDKMDETPAKATASARYGGD